MTKENKEAEILQILDRTYKLWQSVATIIDQELRIRDEIRGNRENWDRICSSSDVINDTIGAVASYVKSDYPDDDIGLKYIFIYGLLQALYLQQDAVENLFKALHDCYPQSKNFCYKRSDELEAVRFLRNEATGHPTGTHSGIFTYISRGTLSKWHFTRLCSFNSKEKEGNQFLPVDLFSLLKKQALEIENDLGYLVRNLTP